MQTAGKGTPQGSSSTGSNGGQQKPGLDHGDTASSLKESPSLLLQSDRHQKGGSTITSTISSSSSSSLTASRDDRSRRSSTSTSNNTTAGGSSSTVIGINGGLSLVDADKIESQVWGADHGVNHDSDSMNAALEANKKLVTAASSMTEALEKDYAQKYEQLMAEEAAREAAESASSTAAQAAAVYAPTALSAADYQPFTDPYFDGRLFNFNPATCPLCIASHHTVPATQMTS